ncbi:MinD-like ATPase involved in chromosome partitioning or flagellar assembly [Pseudonocardia thermophila]|jgi:ATPases involved in chromosome partitioning|uniref:MinD-like ATPase involved in chromosome partitioning or flagellar assembly n=1 Tax=Pseudonocardia thermophila TaxID=1848 RepID=A0A1M6UD22_PSETH|nr:MinD/ParA family protein [Pseudonocardia thermophila]SHK67070.1 MinD-like ATPase involved in chromosome partitioning or flagellar assembly [Pseudonocardia thermophila]
MTAPYRGGDFFVPADDPPPQTPQERPLPTVRPTPSGSLFLPAGVRPADDSPRPIGWAFGRATGPDPDDDDDEGGGEDEDPEPALWLPGPLPAWPSRPVRPDQEPKPRPRMLPTRPQRRERAPRPAVDWRGRPVAPGLTSDAVVRRRPARPGPGWRRVVFDLTGGRWNPGPGAIAAARSERLRQIRRPLRDCHRIAVLSVKGGVGKTTVTAMLGLTFAQLRGDRVLAIDANPDLGTLADRLTGDTEVGMQHLLDFLSDRPAFSIGDIESFMSTTERLHVLAGSQEPGHGSAFTPDEYEEAIEALSSCYTVLVIDTGTGLSHAALAGVLATTHGVVIVGEPTVDAASRASMTLDWLAGSGYPQLAADAIVVMSQDRGCAEIDERVIREHFGPRCAAVVDVPADPHLGTGGRIDVAACQPATIEAFEELAAAVTAAFPEPGPRRRPREGR